MVQESAQQVMDRAVIERSKLLEQVRQTRGVAHLRGRAIFELTGADRVRFLNGQVTNDVRHVSPAHALHACILTAKGKMCGDVFITAKNDALVIDADPALRADLPARLERYIISDDVTLRDVTDEKAFFHFLGMAEDELAAMSGVAPIRSIRFGPHGFDVVFPVTEIPPLLSGSAVDEEGWEILRIASGVPRWGYELTSETLPAEAGLDQSAVDFSKGCYVGQEVVSRIRSVGHVNKSLYVFAALESIDLCRGARLVSEGHEVGSLTSAAGSLALGYLKRGVTSRVFDARMRDDPAVKVEIIEPLASP
jgi:folate-binding protein YgfZ